METGLPDAAAALRRAGLRVTASRLAVLTALATGPPHASVDVVVGAVRDRLGDVSAQTVYNVLHALTEVGLVRRIEPAGRPGLYELRVGDNHHHLVCRQCDAIADVDCAVGDAPCLTAADDMDYEIDTAEVIYWGLCPDCATALASGGFARAAPTTLAPRHGPRRRAGGVANDETASTSREKEAGREEKQRRV